MSRYFQAGDLVLWNPATRVAELFVRHGEAISATVGLPTGVAAVVADEYEVDLDTFAVFVDAVVHHYLSSSHLIMRSLVEGFAVTGIVLVERAGRSVPALAATPAIGLRDVPAGPGGIAAPGDAGRLRELAEEHARAMAV